MMVDNDTKTPIFSKFITVASLVLSIAVFASAPILNIFFGLSETIAVSMISASSAICLTSFVSYQKKSARENIVKIQIGAYREIIKIKRENNENVDEFINKAKDKLIDRIDNTLDDDFNESSQINIERIDL